MRSVIFIFFILIHAAHASPQDTYPFSSQKQSLRFQSLTREIRCVVCQSQSIADSNAPLAKDLRKKIYVMVLQNKKNNEIKNYLVKRYGEFILLKPRLTPVTFWLWVLPFLGLGCAVLFYHSPRKFMLRWIVYDLRKTLCRIMKITN